MDKRWLLGKISNHNINRKDGTFVKTAVICMNGFEEVEGLTVVDMLRRLEIDCDIVGKGAEVTGSHGIVIKADKLLEEIKAEYYNAIILPGGLPGATNLRDDSKVISLVNEGWQYYHFQRTCNKHGICLCHSRGTWSKCGQSEKSNSLGQGNREIKEVRKVEYGGEPV